MALAAAIWFNNKTGAPVTRSLIAFDHRALQSNSSRRDLPRRPERSPQARRELTAPWERSSTPHR
jgi:hypothetical protein